MQSPKRTFELRQNGFSLVGLIISMFVIGIFIGILVALINKENAKEISAEKYEILANAANEFHSEIYLKSVIEKGPVLKGNYSDILENIKKESIKRRIAS